MDHFDTDESWQARMRKMERQAAALGLQMPTFLPPKDFLTMSPDELRRYPPSLRREWVRIATRLIQTQ